MSNEAHVAAACVQMLVNRKYVVRLKAWILPPLFSSLLPRLSAMGRGVRMEGCDGREGGGCGSICWILKQTGGQRLPKNDSDETCENSLKILTMFHCEGMFVFYSHRW